MLIVDNDLTINSSNQWDGVCILVGGQLTSNGNNVSEGATLGGLNYPRRPTPGDVVRGRRTGQRNQELRLQLIAPVAKASSCHGPVHDDAQYLDGQSGRLPDRPGAIGTTEGAVPSSTAPFVVFSWCSAELRRGMPRRRVVMPSRRVRHPQLHHPTVATEAAVPRAPAPPSRRSFHRRATSAAHRGANSSDTAFTASKWCRTRRAS